MMIAQREFRSLIHADSGGSNLSSQKLHLTKLKALDPTIRVLSGETQSCGGES